jgi:hypothetical protein
METFLPSTWGRPKQSDEAEITHRYVVELPPVLNKVAGEVRKYRQADGGIGADPVTVI